jgi:hypothetical protein
VYRTSLPEACLTATSTCDFQLYLLTIINAPQHPPQVYPIPKTRKSYHSKPAQLITSIKIHTPNTSIYNQQQLRPNFTQTTMSSSPSPPDTSTNADASTETEAEATLASSESLQTDMPLTMAASVVLDHLPRDAHTALSKAGLLEQDKSISFHPSILSYHLPLPSSLLLPHPSTPSSKPTH